MENKINDSKNKNNIIKDYSLYSNEPEKLLKIAQEQINQNNIKQGIDILKNTIDLARKKFSGENKIELTKFYNKYADAILQKIISSQNNNDNDNYITDSDIAYKYINEANEILENYLEQYNDKSPNDLNKDIINYYLQLSYNYNLLAIYSKVNLDYKNANEFYNISIDITKKYDDKFSRNLTALYFEQAQILIYDPNKCLLSLYKCKVIMEYYLQKEITKINLDIKLYLDENDLDLNNISYNDEKIYKNKDLIETNIELNKSKENNPNIAEFMDIIKDINNKIENVVLELKEYDAFKKKREEIKKIYNVNNENINNENINKENIMNDLTDKMSKINLINFRRNEPSGGDDDIKKVEEDYTKEKLI